MKIYKIWSFSSPVSGVFLIFPQWFCSFFAISCSYVWSPQNSVGLQKFGSRGQLCGTIIREFTRHQAGCRYTLGIRVVSWVSWWFIQGLERIVNVWVIMIRTSGFVLGPSCWKTSHGCPAFDSGIPSAGQLPSSGNYCGLVVSSSKAVPYTLPLAWQLLQPALFNQLVR